MSEQANTCVLWDDSKERHRKEASLHISYLSCSCAQYCCQVEEAQKRAIAEYQEEHPEPADDAVQVRVAEVSVCLKGQQSRTHLFVVFLFVSAFMYYMS